MGTRDRPTARHRKEERRPDWLQLERPNGARCNAVNVLHARLSKCADPLLDCPQGSPDEEDLATITKAIEA
jgi:hypothetical protein